MLLWFIAENKKNCLTKCDFYWRMILRINNYGVIASIGSIQRMNRIISSSAAQQLLPVWPEGQFDPIEEEPQVGAFGISKPRLTISVGTAPPSRARGAVWPDRGRASSWGIRRRRTAWRDAPAECRESAPSGRRRCNPPSSSIHRPETLYRLIWDDK